MPLTTHRFTLDEYHRMGEAGVFHEDDRVELIDGQIVEMSPIGMAHASAVNRLTRLFAPLAAGDATLSIQNPVILAEHQEPRPDVALLRYRADGYRARRVRASDILLIIEVGDTTVGWDRGTKLPRYATAGIPEAWLVNLSADVVEVCRYPGPEGYRDVRTARRGEAITALGLPGVTLLVGDVLGEDQPGAE